MKTSRLVCAVVGLILIMTTVTVFQFSQVLPTIRLVELTSVRGTAEIASTYQAVTAGPAYFYDIYIEVIYPVRVYKDETINIRTLVSQKHYVFDPNPNSYGWLSTDPARPVFLNSLQWPIHFSLDGAAFTIDPGVHLFEINSPLPLDVHWTAFPKNTGTHSLLLDVSKIKPVGSRWHSHTVSNSAYVNGIEIRPSQPVENTIPGFESPLPVSVLNLPVEVVTQWGISQLWADVIAIVASILAFVLGLPFLSAAVSWFLQRTRAES